MSNRVRVGLLIASIAVSAAAIWFASGSDDVAPVPEATPIAKAPATPRAASPRTAQVIDAGAEDKEDPPLPPDGQRIRVMSGGQPVAGSSVALYLASGPRHHGRKLPAARAIGRKDGWVIFGEVVIEASDKAEVVISAPFFFPLRAPYVEGGTVEVEPLPPMKGVVLNPDRTPAQGATVSTEGPSPVSAVTGGDGRFLLKTANRGPLLAALKGASARFEGFDWQSHDNPDIELVLKDDPTFIGLVVGRDQAPLEGVSVSMTAGANTRHFVTGPDGQWQGPMFGQVDPRMVFSKQGYVRRELFVGQLRLHKRIVVLSRPGRIEGTVITHDGLPAVGATYEHSGDVLPVDENGQFTIENVDDESVAIEVLRGEATARQVVDVPEGQTVQVQLMLPPELIEVELEIVDAFGEEVDDWEAVATPVPAVGWTSTAESVMAPRLGLRQGRFRIAVNSEERELSGEVTVDVNPAVDDRPIRIVVHAADGGRGRPADFELPRDPIGAVKVKVMTPNGAPALDATVDCGEGMVKGLGGGTFECPFFEDTTGAIVITASLGESSAVAHATMSQKEVTLTVQPRRTIRGKVTGAIPLNAYLEVNSSAEQTEEPLTSNDFALANRAAVRTIVCVGQHLPGKYDQKLGCAVSVGDEVLQIPLGSPGTLQLSVQDEKGKPVESLMLYVDRRGQPVEAPQGRVSLPIEPGTHVLIVNAPGNKGRAEQLFTIRSGQVTDLGPVKMQ